MSNPRRVITQLLFLIIASLSFSAPALAQLKVLMSAGFGGAYQRALPEFEKETGITVTTASGASQGTGPQTIEAQLKRGTTADVVILSREGLADLAAAGLIVAGSDADLARAGLGVAVRAGAPVPDVSTVAAFRQAMLNAKTVAVAGSTSGIFLTSKIFPELGIDHDISVTMTDRASEALKKVAAGEIAITVQPVSELATGVGLTFAGKVPPELELLQVFAAAIVKGAKEPELGRRLIEFLASARAAAAIRQSGMELVQNPAAP